MNLRLSSGSVRPGEAAKEQILRFDVDERDIVMVAEQADDLLGLVGAHQAMIDEHAGQLVADRFVDQHRRDRAVDPARKAANHPAVADLLANLGDLGGPELGHRPAAGETADVADEIGEQPAAVGRVDDLRVEHQAVESARLVDRHGVRRALRAATTSKPSGNCSTRSPWLIQTWWVSPGDQRPSNKADSPIISMKARPNSRLSDGATRPPSWCAMVCWP